MSVDLMIKNGQVVTASGVYQTDVAVACGKVAALGVVSPFLKAERVLSANGQIAISRFTGGGRVGFRRRDGVYTNW
jgi:predicted amidohydrolase